VYAIYQKYCRRQKVLLLVSGGVDLTLCAGLLQKALSKDHVIALYINNGFMRKKKHNWWKIV